MYPLNNTRVYKVTCLQNEVAEKTLHYQGRGWTVKIDDIFEERGEKKVTLAFWKVIRPLDFYLETPKFKRVEEIKNENIDFQIIQ